MSLLHTSTESKVQSPQSTPLEERVRLLLDGLLHYGGYLAQYTTSFFLIPLFYRKLPGSEYGIWIFAVGLAFLPALVDFGLFWSITMKVAEGKSGTEEQRKGAIEFVRMAGRAYGWLGLIGGAGIIVAGLLLRHSLHLDVFYQQTEQLVFVLIGLNFVVDELTVYCYAVFQALRRFDLSNLSRTLVVVFRTSGFAMILISGRGVIALAEWNIIGGALALSVMLWIMKRTSPQYMPSPGFVRMDILNPQLSFGLASLFVMVVVGALWSAPPLLLGLFLGPAAIIPFHVGKSFPNSMSSVNFRTAEVLFPAASEHHFSDNTDAMRRTLETGTRWAVVLVLAPFIALEVLAPDLLQLWLGSPPIEASLTLRMMALAVMVESLGAASLHVLWGRGKMRPIIAILSSMLVAQVALACYLIPRKGVVGAVQAFIVPAIVGWMVFAWQGARICGESLWRFLEHLLSGLGIPAVACTGFTVALADVLPHEYGANVVLSAIAGGMVYLVVFFALGARAEEKAAMDQVLALPGRVLRLRL